MFCKNCNLTFENNVKFCSSCGNKLVDMELLAMLPEGERDNEDIIGLISWKLLNLNFDIGLTYIQNFIDYLEFDYSDYSNKAVSKKIDYIINKRNKILNFIKENIWLFESANHVLNTSGESKVDMNFLNLKNININDVKKMDDNSDKIDALDDYDMEMDEFMNEFDQYCTDLSDKLEKLNN